jgi:transcriptional regulator of acetoin/glycerol metabolism
MGSPRLRWEKPSNGLLVVAQHKRVEAVSRVQEHLEAHYQRGRDPKQVVAPLLKEEEKKNQIKRSTRRSKLLYTANCQVFTCILVFLH